MTNLLKTPITDPGNINFIKAEFLTHSSVIEQMQENGKTKKVVADKIACLRFIVILCKNDDVRAAFLQSTDGKTVLESDYQNSNKAPTTWMDLLCELFNDPKNEYRTQIIIGLHEEFRKEINCATEYVWTPDACKTIMSSMKTKLHRIIYNYI